MNWTAKVHIYSLFLIKFFLQLSNHLFHLLEFVHHIFVVVLSHGVNKERVNKRHADDTASKSKMQK